VAEYRSDGNDRSRRDSWSDRGIGGNRRREPVSVVVFVVASCGLERVRAVLMSVNDDVRSTKWLVATVGELRRVRSSKYRQGHCFPFGLWRKYRPNQGVVSAPACRVDEKAGVESIEIGPRGSFDE